MWQLGNDDHRFSELHYFFGAADRLHRALRDGASPEDVQFCVQEIQDIKKMTEQPLVRQRCCRLLKEPEVVRAVAI